jgi:hypothetical protein
VEPDLARLIVRHRDVAPMLSALLTGTNAGVRITDPAGTVVLEREAGGIAFERFPIVVEGESVGFVEGDRIARSIASVLSYALSREADKRSLAREALDRYRELNLVYELADRLSGATSVEHVASIAIEEAGRLPAGGAGFVLVAGPDGEAHPVGTGAVDWIVRPGEESRRGARVGRRGGGQRGRDRPAPPSRNRPRPVVAAPLVARGRALGLLGAASTIPIGYQAADLKLIAAIAAIAGPALAHVRAPADDRTPAPAG